MTNKEIKLKLSEIALNNGLSIESVMTFYEWITDEPEKTTNVEGEQTDFDDVPASTIVNHVRKNNNRVGGYAVRLGKVLNSNNIETVGDILRLGRDGFKKIYSVGGGMVWRVDDALEKLYGINYW